MNGMARDPQDLPELYARLFNSWDLAGLRALYAPDAVLMLGGGRAPVRRAGLSDALAASLARRVPITVQNRRAVVAGDTALLVTDWWMQGTDVNRRPVC